MLITTYCEMGPCFGIRLLPFCRSGSLTSEPDGWSKDLLYNSQESAVRLQLISENCPAAQSEAASPPERI